ncbi:unnamed protein product [Porites lobata]|uniref:Uncharacterized protein n=1 Tax=Porites lobata TaxID=104759 RepID=A0ABN8QDI3_9CNID|nr:unnamed protein product [Porites lobata]
MQIIGVPSGADEVKVLTSQTHTFKLCRSNLFNTGYYVDHINKLSVLSSFIVSRSDATERLNKDLHEPRTSVIFSTIRCHRKTGQGFSRARSLCYLQYCMYSMFCFVIQLLSEPDKQDCWPVLVSVDMQSILYPQISYHIDLFN